MKIEIKLLFVLGILVMGVSLCSALLPTSMNEKEQNSIEHTNIIELTSPPLPIYSSYEDMNKYSDLIVLGTVTKISDPKWSTVSGKQPVGITIKEVMEKDGKYLYYTFDYKENETIYTDITFLVNECYKGELTSKEITIRSFGGTIGEFRMNDFDYLNPEDFKEGEEILLYLTEDRMGITKDIGPEHYIFLSPTGKLYAKGDLLINVLGEKYTAAELLKK
ncbi:hypothetical protein MmiHf6_08790 [Methanimicrococcus hongohii]|uniref:Uncharacterized protein n=1 Tax=Methanimicrococcus hongohii TaxID=3028295 RepID=A0AA96ZSK2_9EURY|nr:hypothetical protein [Methanimicrococcus sp. Hf6]WNY23570.1 hypothetical protein MmiHf6_08790 [Methanimicrococcus sp. Hf6]